MFIKWENHNLNKEKKQVVLWCTFVVIWPHLKTNWSFGAQNFLCLWEYKSRNFLERKYWPMPSLHRYMYLLPCLFVLQFSRFIWFYACTCLFLPNVLLYSSVLLMSCVSNTWFVFNPKQRSSNPWLPLLPGHSSKPCRDVRVVNGNLHSLPGGGRSQLRWQGHGACCLHPKVKALFNKVSTLKNLSCLALHAISVFDFIIFNDFDKYHNFIYYRINIK